MFLIVWEYLIEPSMQSAFEQYYHDEGIWAQCFQQHPDFIATRLLHDTTDPYRYLTIDYWRTERSFDQFYRHYRAEYDAIDALCQSFTRKETRLGTFVTSIVAGAAGGLIDGPVSTPEFPT